MIIGRKSKSTLKRRFMKKVRMEPNGCWTWTGATYRGGYGAFKISSYTFRGAHRVSYEMHVGPVPADLYVCHHCDNPLCVNPVHLYAGTPTDNARDRDIRR